MTSVPRCRAAIRRCLIAMLLFLPWMPLAAAQEEPAPLRVATFLLPPYAIQDGDRLSGFSIDLWEAAAAKLELDFTYEVVPDVQALLDKVAARQAEVGVSGVFITAERDKTVDFSVSILNAGLQVMVPSKGSGAAPSPLASLWNLVVSPAAAIWLGVAFVIIIIPAHIIWLLDRGTEESVSVSRKYIPGIFHGLVWATTALVSQVQQLPRQWLARVLALIWMFVGVVFISLYTAELTANLTVEQIRGAIDGPGDLPGKRVATIAASTSAAYLRSINAKVQEYPLAEDMYKALLDGDAEAVLFSAPTLKHFAAHDGTGLVRLVGPEFRKSDLGIVLPLNDPLRKRINAQLLSFMEDGTYQVIYEKWFGKD